MIARRIRTLSYLAFGALSGPCTSMPARCLKVTSMHLSWLRKDMHCYEEARWNLGVV